MQEKPKAKPVKTVVYLDPELVDWLDVQAGKQDRSRTWLVNDICQRFRQAKRRASKRKGGAA